MHYVIFPVSVPSVRISQKERANYDIHLDATRQVFHPSFGPDGVDLNEGEMSVLDRYSRKGMGG